MQALRFNVTIPQALALKALQPFLKGIFYRSPFQTIKLTDVPEPTLPTPEWVKVKTKLCGFCGSDSNLIHLADNPTSEPFTSLPVTLGHEVMGEVVEVGENADGVSVGDRVTISPILNCTAREIDPVCPACETGRISSCENFARGSLSPGIFNFLCTDVGGGFAPYCVAHKSQIFKLPDKVSDAEGALIEPLAVALQAVIDILPENNDDVLVIGNGVIGNLIVQCIRALNIDCRITVVDPSPLAGSRAREAGADHLIQDGDLFGQTVNITGARRYKPPVYDDILMGGYNRVFDNVGTRKTVNTGMRCLAVGGKINVLAFKDIKIDFSPMFLKSLAMQASLAYKINKINDETEHVFSTAIQLAAEKKIELASLLTHQFPIDEYQRMIEVNLNKGKHQAFKTALVFPVD